MILYLDVVSSIPEFSIIEHNKIIFSTKIIQSVDEKLSDNIIPKYLEMDKSFNFQTPTNAHISDGATALKLEEEVHVSNEMGINENV